MKKTIVFITHDFDEATKLADRIGIMKDGRMVQLDTPEEIVLHPANDYVAEFARNAPHEKVISIGAIMEPIAADAVGTVHTSAKIVEVAPLILMAGHPIGVDDDAGVIVGSVNRKDISDALFSWGE